MPDLDPLAYLQLVGIAITWLAAVGLLVWRIRKSTGTDRDMLVLLGLVGGGVSLTLLQFIGLMVRLG